MVSGKKMMAIFGFIIINDFGAATEILQTGIMLFVNEIAQVVHGTVDEFCGQTNKVLILIFFYFFYFFNNF